MKISTRIERLSFWTMAGFLSAWVLAPAQLVAVEFEKPPVLSASKLLAPEILASEDHQVDEAVKNDGLFNHYSVTSSFGDFTADSTQSLKFLVSEIAAISAMRQVKTDDTAINSLKQSGKNTVQGVKNLFSDPEATLEGAASGVGSLFNRATSTVGNREVSETEDSKMEQFIGFSKSKGEIATKYKVNVYSHNQVLQEELERLAWADYLGGLGVGVATSVIPGVGGLVLATSGTARLLNEAINTTPASELWLQNKNKLLAMGMNEDTVELFLNNPVFSPALSTVMTTALDSMKEVENRELFLKVALQASDPRMARVITEFSVLAAGFDKNVEPLKKLAPMARILRGEKKDGTIVLLLPSDYLIWSEMVAGTIATLGDKAQSTGAGVEVWSLGEFSDTARNQLEAVGLKLYANAHDKLIPSTK